MLDFTFIPPLCPPAPPSSFFLLYTKWQINKSKYETRKNRYSKCVSLCSVWKKKKKKKRGRVTMAASYSGFSRGRNLWLEQRSSVSVREHKAAVLVRPDLSYYRRADPKKPFSSSPLVLLILAALSASKSGSQHIIWVCTSVNYYSNSLYVY